MDDLLQRVRRCEALQQPEWGDPSRLRDVQAYLRGSPALIRAGDILALRATLARVARGEALVVQCGDCAEDMDDHHAENVARKAAVLELLAGALRLAGRRPVIRVGRIAGSTPSRVPSRTSRSASRPCRSIAATWSTAARPMPSSAGPIRSGFSRAMRRRATSCATWAGTPRPGRRRMPRRSGPATRCCCSTTSCRCCARTSSAGSISVRPTGRGSASAPARSTAPMWRCWPRCSTRWPARSVRRSAATSCWRSASASTRAASRGA